MFSVVIPLYNKESHIAFTLQSILDQTFSDFEVIIVDDGSNDSSLEIVRSFEDSRVNVYCQKNSGVSAARNRGIKEAKFDYIAFIDADDYWHPDYLDIMNGLIRRNPSCGLFGCGYEVVNSDGVVERLVQLPEAKFKEGSVVNSYFKSLVAVDSFIWTSATCVRKSIFYDHQVWFPVGETYGEDQYVWSCVAMHANVAYINFIGAFYVIDADNNTVSGLENRDSPSACIMALSTIAKGMLNGDEYCYLEQYLGRHMAKSIRRNARNGRRLRALHQFVIYRMSLGNSFRCLFDILTSSRLRKFLNAWKSPER